MDSLANRDAHIIAKVAERQPMSFSRASLPGGFFPGSTAAQPFHHNQRRKRTMKEHITLALVAAVLLAACQSQKPEYEVSRIKIGDTRASVLAVVPDLACKTGERAGVERCTGHGPAFEAIPTKMIILNLDRGKVEYVAAAVDASHADNALAAIKEKYGPEDKGEGAASFRDPGLIEWSQWARDGKQLLRFYLPDSGSFFVSLRSPMYSAMHEVMPRLNLPAPDIKGVKLGDPYDDVRAMLPDAECTVVEAETQCRAEAVTYGGSRRAHLFLRLRGDSVRGIFVGKLEPEDYASLMKAMVEKFGPPDDEEQRKSRSGLGPNDTAWSMPYNRVIIASNPGDGTAPTVSLLDMDFYGALLRESAKKNVEAL